MQLIGVVEIVNGFIIDIFVKVRVRMRLSIKIIMSVITKISVHETNIPTIHFYSFINLTNSCIIEGNGGFVYRVRLVIDLVVKGEGVIIVVSEFLKSIKSIE